MINQFLATLDNNTAAPASFLWPTFTARIPVGHEATIRGALIGLGLSREQSFLRCLQLTNLVHESPLAGYVTAADHRLTYSTKAVRDRFSISGVVVQDTSTSPSDSTLTMVVQQDTPEISAWTLLMTDGTHVKITNDLGLSVTQVISFSGGVSNLISGPSNLVSFRFTDSAPLSGQSWSVSYQAAGASWIPQALVRLEGVDPRPIMSPDLLSWYDQAPTALDRLAAAVVALGTAE